MNSASPPAPQILIVEDEIFVAMDVEQLLQENGYVVKGIAMDRSEALRLGEGCCVALVDVNLRDGRTGPQIATELYEKYAVKTVFATANPGQIGTPPKGSLGYISKPFDAKMLCDAIDWALGEGHAEPANDAVVRLEPMATQQGG